MSKSQPENTTCFVISPIGEDGTEIRRRADQILKHIIAPAALECGYVAVRADGIDVAGTITSQVVQHIVDDPMVVADLTGRNPNVFYELAIRHAIRKPVVQLIQQGETIPFDVASTRTIKVDHHDLDSAAACKEQLVRQMKAAMADPTAVDNPITVALNVQSLHESDNPLAASAAELLSGMNEIKGMLASTMEDGRRIREFDLVQADDILRATGLIRAMIGLPCDGDIGISLNADGAAKLSMLVERIELLAGRSEDRGIRLRKHAIVVPTPRKAEELKKSGGPEGHDDGPPPVPSEHPTKGEQ